MASLVVFANGMLLEGGGSWPGFICITPNPPFTLPLLFPPQAASSLSPIILKLLLQQQIRTRKGGRGKREGREQQGKEEGRRTRKGGSGGRGVDEGKEVLVILLERGRKSWEQSQRSSAGNWLSQLHTGAHVILVICRFFSCNFFFFFYEFAYLLKLFVTPKPILVALLWSFVDSCRATENLSHPLCTFPAEVEQGTLCLLVSGLILETGSFAQCI